MVLGRNGKAACTSPAGLIQKMPSGNCYRIQLHIPAELNSRHFAHAILAHGGELHKEIMREVGCRISIHPKVAAHGKTQHNSNSKSKLAAATQILPVDVEI